MSAPPTVPLGAFPVKHALMPNTWLHVVANQGDYPEGCQVLSRDVGGPAPTCPKFLTSWGSRTSCKGLGILQIEGRKILAELHARTVPTTPNPQTLSYYLTFALILSRF